MSEKEEVLRQINEIKSHLVDKETFFPYNFNACHVWSVITVVLTLAMMPMYQYSIVLGTTLTSLLIILGFMIEGSLTKKENESYDIEDCTKRQQFIMQNFIMLSLFGIVLSAVLAHYQLYVGIFLIWLFLIALGQFSVGFVLNIREFSRMAMFNMSMALILLALGSYFNLLEAQGLFLNVVQVVVILGLAVLPSWVAYRQQTLGNSQKACGV
jgi:hypothetical protein